MYPAQPVPAATDSLEALIPAACVRRERFLERRVWDRAGELLLCGRMDLVHRHRLTSTLEDARNGRLQRSSSVS